VFLYAGGEMGAYRRSGGPGSRWRRGLSISRGWIFTAGNVVDTLFFAPVLRCHGAGDGELWAQGGRSTLRPGRGRPDVHRRQDIQWTFDHDPESLKEVQPRRREGNLALSELLGYPFFLQTRIFLTLIRRFLSAETPPRSMLFPERVLRQRASVPRPKGGGEFEGATRCVCDRVVPHVVHCDVLLLYPRFCFPIASSLRAITLIFSCLCCETSGTSV